MVIIIVFSHRTREGLVKVISQLKNGEEVCPLFATNTNVNEDSSSAEVPAQLEVNEKVIVINCNTWHAVYVLHVKSLQVKTCETIVLVFAI